MTQNSGLLIYKSDFSFKILLNSPDFTLFQGLYALQALKCITKSKYRAYQSGCLSQCLLRKENRHRLFILSMMSLLYVSFVIICTGTSGIVLFKY